MEELRDSELRTKLTERMIDTKFGQALDMDNMERRDLKEEIFTSVKQI